MLCLFSLVTFTSNTYAYNLLGGKQKTKNIVYQINSSLTSGYHTSLTSAMSAWDSATSLSFSKKSGSTTDVQIYVNGADYGDVGWNAEAINYKDWVIVGNFANSAINANYYYMKDMKELKRQGVFAHEIGHTLGLAHVTDTQQVMCTDKDGRAVSVPGSDDIKGIKAIYN